MYRQALLRLTGHQMDALGVDGSQLIADLQLREQAAAASEPAAYQDITFIITDEKLMKACQLRCEEKGLQWGLISDHAPEEVTHRHLHRDRSGVVAARAAAADARRKT